MTYIGKKRNLPQNYWQKIWRNFFELFKTVQADPNGL